MNEADKIMTQFEGFTDGVRFLMLTHRSKDGGKNRDRKQTFKKFSKNEKEFKEILIEYLEIMSKSKIPYRIYSSVNKRNVKKAMREFKRQQLDADYDENPDNFYFDVKNRWISSAMRPSSREDTNFIIDIDEGEDVEKCIRKLAHITRNYIKYETKNGWHIIVQPFDPRLMEGWEIKKDGLLLLKY